MATEQLAPIVPAAPAQDRMPIHAIDHIELYVGNAAQAAYYLTRAFGFAETAYSGLETGRRDRVSHVLEQGRVRFVVTGTLKGGDEIARHHARHGDGVHKIASECPMPISPIAMPSSTAPAASARRIGRRTIRGGAALLGRDLR